MYNRPYKFQTTDELRRITGLADFYCALPIVSATLSGGLLGSPIFQISPRAENCNFSDFELEAPALLDAAIQLRHAVLLRECFIHTVSQWPQVRSGEGLAGVDALGKVAETKCSHLIKNAYIHILEMIIDINQGMNLIPRYDIAKVHGDCGSHFQPATQDALFYRRLKLLVDSQRVDKFVEIRETLNNLMKNNLALNRTGSVPGEAGGPYVERFLCANIANEDMPWDPQRWTGRLEDSEVGNLGAATTSTRSSLLYFMIVLYIGNIDLKGESGPMGSHMIYVDEI